jgi:trehalose-phosphatase
MTEDLNTEKLLARIRDTAGRGMPLSLLCDYDGTLAPIVDRPERAVLGPGMRDVLQGLARNSRVRLAIISGRPLPVLITFLNGIDNITLIGDHGAALENADLFAQQAARFARDLHWLTRKYPGCELEDKGVAVGVHFRRANPDLAPALMADFFDWWLEHGNPGDFQVANGKKVFEIRPRVKTNKGTAVLGLLERWHGEVWAARTMALYCGDDTTDEDAFAALARAPRHAAATILVAEHSRPTNARFRVPNVAQLEQFLSRVLHALENTHPTK